MCCIRIQGRTPVTLDRVNQLQNVCSSTFSISWMLQKGATGRPMQGKQTGQLAVHWGGQVHAVPLCDRGLMPACARRRALHAAQREGRQAARSTFECTCRPSGEMPTAVTGASCSASRKKSEKSTGHTRTNLSSQPVIANPSFTAIALIAAP